MMMLSQKEDRYALITIIILLIILKHELNNDNDYHKMLMSIVTSVNIILVLFITFIYKKSISRKANIDYMYKNEIINYNINPELPNVPFNTTDKNCIYW